MLGSLQISWHVTRALRALSAPPIFGTAHFCLFRYFLDIHSAIQSHESDIFVVSVVLLYRINVFSLFSFSVRDVYDYFRAIVASDEKSDRALQLTKDAADLNPANYSVW